MTIDKRMMNEARRAFLATGAKGIGSVALASLLGASTIGNSARGEDGTGKSGKIGGEKGILDPPPLPQKAKRIIWLTMAGGPSQFETFDPKPKLAQYDGQPMPESLTKGQQLAQLQGQKLVCYGPQFPFQRFGKNQTEICSLFPHIGSVIDDICLIRSMTTDAINHDPAHMFMNTGAQIPGRPSMGAWVTYGLGCETQELPGFVVMVSTGVGRSPQPIAARQWSSGFLPSKHQGVQLRSRGDSVLYLSSPDGVDRAAQQRDVEAINALNREFGHEVPDNEISTRISQYEMAFRMQASVPELMDISKEKPETLEMYGCQPGDGSFASNCLLARRLAERGVRFVQLYHRDWDHHSQLREEMPVKAKETDQASAALIKDLKDRGMLDETLVVWTGEFGRTPMSQSNKGTTGRDHHNKSMSMWIAGGGIRPGMVWGSTDELGYAAVENVTTVHDLHATMLHQLGIEHNAFSVKFQGLDAKLTGVEGARVLTELLV